MNLEEAKANIGKEVIYIKTNEDYIIDSIGSRSLVFVKKKSREQTYYVDPHLLKLKEQTMQNYKIQVTPETSAEVQNLFFELGYSWVNGNEVYRYPNMKFIYVENGIIFYRTTSEYMGFEYQEITLTQLRDLVVLKRNDVGDATHGAHFSYERFYISENCTKEYVNGKWVDKVSHAMPIPLFGLKEPFKEMKVKELNKFVNLKSTEMTWQDALRAVADGKDVEVKNISWFDINDLKLGQIKKGKAFRLKPQTIYIDGGDYTKEELLKIVGEME